MIEIQYLKGDATAPSEQGIKIIVHVCNDVGAWGKGFVIAISKKWKQPEQKYRQWYKTGDDFALGSVQFIQVEHDLWVANMIGQRDIRIKEGIPPIRYDAIEQGLSKVALEAKKLSASAHMPRIGCGLAGGQWDIIESLIQRTLLANNIKTFVYDFE